MNHARYAISRLYADEYIHQFLVIVIFLNEKRRKELKQQQQQQHQSPKFFCVVINTLYQVIMDAKLDANQ